MKIPKIVLAGVVGTSFMTLYSYIISKQHKDQFVEPVLLNELIDRSEALPDIDEDEKKTNPAGWLIHYGIGMAFVIAYYILWKQSLKAPSLVKGLLLGALSGLIGIAAWKIMFASNDNPPRNNRYRYYRQLFVAHLIFSVFALYGYKLPEYIRELSSKRLT